MVLFLDMVWRYVDGLMKLIHTSAKFEVSISKRSEMLNEEKISTEEMILFLAEQIKSLYYVRTEWWVCRTRKLKGRWMRKTFPFNIQVYVRRKSRTRVPEFPINGMYIYVYIETEKDRLRTSKPWKCQMGTG